MSNEFKKWFIGIIGITIILVILFLILPFFASLNYLTSFRVVFGSIYVLFLPGFIMTFIFFPKTMAFENKEDRHIEIDWLERIALSFSLSVAIVPIFVFYLTIIGIKISVFNVFLTVLIIMLLSGIILVVRKKY